MSTKSFPLSVGPHSYLIKNATLIDVNNSELVKGISLHIKDGRIADIYRGSEIPAMADSFDATGLFLLPGLIDMHVHLVWDG